MRTLAPSPTVEAVRSRDAEPSVPREENGPGDAVHRPRPVPRYVVHGRRIAALRRPLPADRIRAVPPLRRFADLVEDAAPRRCQVRHLDHRAGMSLVGEVHEAPARTVALLA